MYEVICTTTGRFLATIPAKNRKGAAQVARLRGYNHFRVRVQHVQVAPTVKRRAMGKS